MRNTPESAPNSPPPHRSPPATGGERLKRQGGDARDLAESLREDPEFRDALQVWREFPARPARTRPFPERLDPRLVKVMGDKGIHELFEHQARAIEHALDGKDLLVATPTASGKTLCYSLPILQSLLESKGSARALLLFPTKALSQDQSSSLTSLVEALEQDWHAYTYDGDTPPSVRRSLRERGHMILTNPYMLHSGILPNHSKWAELFRDLRYIVIDEVHTLSGVFGSSVANVLRRLLRIAAHYGSHPTFIGCSATIANGAQHAETLFGRKPTVIDEDASPSGMRLFSIYNPPMLNPVAGLRANALEEARKLARHLVGPSHQTIFFCRRRTAVEVLTRYLREAASTFGLEPSEIRGYRGGYLPLLRREIEEDLRSGKAKVVVSTNALELGIDIGSLDVAVLVGYPGSQASFWQRAGRAGRRGKPSLCIQIAQSDPVDQYLARHPDYLFSEPQQKLALDPNNLVILSEQLKCAAFELPFREAEIPGRLADESFGDVPDAAEVLDYLAEESGMLLKRGGRWFWMADAYPAQNVSLDSGEADNVLILDSQTEKAVGEIDRESSITSVHEGAIYQVEGETWIVERFDFKNRRAYVKQVDTDYFTDAQVNTDVRILRLEQCSTRSRADAPVLHPILPEGTESLGEPQTSTDGEDCAIWRGEVHVTTLATMFKKIRFYTRENVGAGDISLPAEELDTEACVLTLSEETAADLGLHGGDRGAAWHGVGHLVRRVAPLYVRCQPNDLGISTQVKAPHFKRPALFLYDRVQGGVGLSDLLFLGHREVLRAALAVAQGCACRNGCPACVGPVEEVGPLGKETAVRILGHLVRGPDLCSVDVPEEESLLDSSGA
ncbi:MAG: DEAD/DEAH box helicase domain-containing protein [Candidatus Paceibacteria bacterium]|jgi:DEAD/DEAH box helicase domain-containing protein